MSDITNTIQQAYNQNLFNGTFYQNVPVSEGVYDLVYGYFLDKTDLKESADALTQTLLTLSYNTKINAVDILTEFDKAPNDSDLKKLMISIFNTRIHHLNRALNIFGNIFININIKTRRSRFSLWVVTDLS